MSATITITLNEIRQIFQPPRTSNASHLRELAQKTNELAVFVEERWERIPSQTRELLTTFAYKAIEPPKGIKAKIFLLISHVYLALALPWLVLQGEVASFVAYANAFQRLLNAILSGIEREEIAYQQSLSAVIEEALTGWETSKDMTAEEACERLRKISVEEKKSSDSQGSESSTEIPLHSILP